MIKYNNNKYKIKCTYKIQFQTEKHILYCVHYDDVYYGDGYGGYGGYGGL